ncbi:MAG: beta-propeller fold lactonase family protein, partial [Candidatus Diapherotrites archaeon]
TKSGYTYAQRRAEVVSTRDTSVDPVYLTPLDPKVTTITPEGGTATNSTGTLELIFPPGAVSEPIDVQATWCEKAEHLPFPLPPNSIFTYAASFEPADARFDQPVTLRVKNTLGFDPGTPIPIGFYNKGSCWEPVGMGIVTDDGQWSEYTISRFSWYDCNLAWRLRRGLKAPTSQENKTPENNAPGKECASSAGSRVGIKTGDLYIDHTLPSTKALNVSKSLILTYTSSTANPSVLFETEANVDSLSAFWAPTSGYLLEAEGIRKEIKYTPTAGDARQAFFFDGRNARGKTLSTGSYPYKITLSNDFNLSYATTNIFGGLPDRVLNIFTPFFVPRSSSMQGRFIIHNQVDSPFGAGWGLAGLQRLHLDPDGDILLTEGDGSSLVFSKKQFAYVTNTGSNSVSVLNLNIDPSSDMVVKTIPVGNRPSAVAVTPDAKYAYIVNNYSHDVSVIDISSDVVISTITVGSRPWELAVRPDGRYVYVGNFSSHNISVIETSSNTVVSTIGGVRYPYGIAFTPDSRYAYVSNYWKNTVSVIDASSNTVVNLIPVGSRPEGVAVTPDGRYVYVCNTQSDDVFVIDTSSDTVVATVPVGDYPVVAAITPDSRYVYVPNHYSGTVSVIDTSSNTVVDTVSVGGGATVVDITPDGRYAYVTTWWSDSVTVIDIFRCNTVVGKIPVGDGPRGVAVMPKVSDTFIPPSGEFSTFVRNPDGTYTRTMKDSTRHYFNSKGLHTSTVDRNGNTTTYTYDEGDRLISITDPVGQVTSFAYSGDHLSTITDPAGRVTRPYYDREGNLVMITNPDGTSKSFTYDSKHLLTSKTDERGNVTSYIYDNYGRIAEVHSPEHEVLKDGQLTREIRISRFRPTDTQHLINDLPEGTGTPDNPAPVVRPEEVRYEVEESCCGIAKRTGSTDKFGGVTEETDALGRTTYLERDENSNPTQIIRPNGAIMTMSYDGRGNLLSSTEQSIDATTSFTYE